MENMFQFGPLNFVQKRLNAIKKIHWPSELLSRQCAFHVTEKPDARMCQVMPTSGMGRSNNVIFSEKVFRGF
jgi:hypothetical protein